MAKQFIARGQITIQVQEDAYMLDWIADWNNNKTEIDSNAVITPKIFAGLKNSNGTLTGTAIGKFPLSILNESGQVVTETIEGIYGFKDGHKTFYINNSGNVQFGRSNHFIKYNATSGKIEFGSGVSLNWTSGIDAINTKINDGQWSEKLTYIDAFGIYTGMLSAGTVNAIHINANQITAGTIDTARINTDALKASLITAANINALTLDVVRGKIGGWSIDADSIFRGTKNNTSGAYTSAAGSITIGSNGLRGFKWKLDSSGAGALAGGNISWDAAGNVTFGSSVSLNWSRPIDQIIEGLGGSNFPKLTYVTSTGIYTGSLSATQINAVSIDAGSIKTGILSADRIAAGSIHSTKLDAASIKTNIINTTYINGLSCTFTKGTIGSWTIAANSIFRGTENNITGNFTVSSGSITIGSNGIRGFKWRFDSTGAGAIAGDNISWDAGGNVTFSPSVTLNWKVPIDQITEGLGGSDFPKLTFITGTGIYTGTLTATQVNAVGIDAGSIKTGTLSADRIAAGSIHSAKLDATSVKANIINTDYINGLSCTFIRGKIGGWTIGADAITVGTIGGVGATPIQIRSSSSGSGYVYNGAFKPYGLTMSWYQSSNAGHFVFGQVNATGTTVKTGFIGLQMMSWDSQEYFCLSANYTKSGSKEIYNRIAGWGFDHIRIWKNNVSLGADGSIQNSTKWQLNNDGSGRVANGNIIWDASGNVTFASSVSLNWTTAANNALESAKSYADTKKTEAINTAATDATTKSNAAKELAQAMAFGKMLYRYPEFYYNNAVHYNGTSNYLSNTSRSIVTYAGCPNSTGYVLRYVATNWNTSTDFRVGGFSFANPSRANAVFIARIIALIPIGRSIQNYHNSFGTGGTSTWLTTNAGTGKWEEYICKITCGSPGTFSTINHFALTGGNAPTAANPVTWYIAYATVIDVRSSERYTTSIDANGIYTGTLTAAQVNAVAINASSITTGTMSVSRIKVDANLQVGGSLLNGAIMVLNNSNDAIATIDKNGLYAIAGNIAGWQLNDRMLFGYNNEGNRKIVIRKDGYIYCIGRDNSGTEVGEDYWALHPDGSADFGNGKIRFNSDGSGFLANKNITWTTAGSVTLTGTINATGGKIGGFDIASGRIGTTATGSGGGGGLAIYNDLFRVGSSTSFVLWGDNTFPAATGAYSTGRVTNNKANSGYTNYGIYIDVKNGSKNYGVWSNASIVGSACIGRTLKTIYFTTNTYTINFSQANIFMVYCNGNYEMTMPTEASVATQFDLSSLPSDFGYVFTFIYNYNWSGSLTLKNIRDQNGALRNFSLEKGDSIVVLICKYPSFHYQILNYYTR